MKKPKTIEYDKEQQIKYLADEVTDLIRVAETLDVGSRLSSLIRGHLIQKIQSAARVLRYLRSVPYEALPPGAVQRKVRLKHVRIFKCHEGYELFHRRFQVIKELICKQYVVRKFSMIIG